MTEKGTIDTESIYKEITNDNYKHSEEIVRTLLSNPASIKIVYDFYKMQNDDAKLETRLAKSINEILYGYSSEDSLVVEKLEDMMKSIPDFESKGISIGDVKSSISEGNVTTQESQSATQDMKMLMEIKRLQVMQKNRSCLNSKTKTITR